MAKKAATKRRESTIRLADLKPWDRNPRDITAKAAFGLRESMTRFGDLSGIVYNTRLKALVCGHQRTSQATALCNGSNPVVRIMGDGRGLLTVGDEKFAVRLVDWDEATHAAANIAANAPTITGEFNDLTGELLRDMVDDHELWESMSLGDLAESLPLANDSDVEEVVDPAIGPHAHELETRPYEHYDYVLVLASTVGEWNQLCDRLRLEQRSVGKEGVRRVGLCRAVHASRLLEMLGGDLPDRSAVPSSRGEHAEDSKPVA